MKVTGLTKGSLYGNFRDKEEISLEAFKYAVAKIKDLAKSELDGISTYKGQLIALLDFYACYVFDPPVAGGCPMLNTAIEADDAHPSMRTRVTKELMDTVNFIAALLSKGVRVGEFKKGIKPKEIAYTFFCAVEGAIMFSRVERSRQPMNIIVKHCKNMLEQISK